MGGKGLCGGFANGDHDTSKSLPLITVATGDAVIDGSSMGGGGPIDGLVKIGIVGVAGLGFVGDETNAPGGVLDGSSKLAELCNQSFLSGAEACEVKRVDVIEQVDEDLELFLFAPADLLQFETEILFFTLICFCEQA